MTQNQSPSRADAPEQDKPKVEPQQPMKSPPAPGTADPQAKSQNKS